MTSKTMPLSDHLKELRKTIIISSITTIICSLIMYFAFGSQLFSFIQHPIRALGVPLIAISVLETFMVKIKLSLLGGFILAFPVIIWQVGSYVFAALTKKEKSFVLILFPISLLLFMSGIFFAYLVIFPLAIRFLLLSMVDGINPMISIKNYVSFLISFLIPFGLVFQLPLFVFVLGKLGLIHPDTLAKKRKYAFFAIVVLAALLTPGPDVVTQLLMAFPMYLIYEVSIWVSRLVFRNKSSVSYTTG